jgi:hypothetical protein
VKLTLTSEVAPGTVMLAATPWVIERLLVSPPGGGAVSAQIRDVPAGWVRIVAQAFATPDGTGEVIAVASVTTRVVVAHTTDVGLITEALCTSVSVKPSSFTIAPGKTASPEATAYDADGNVLLGATFDWVSSNNDVASVDAASGEVRGVTEGLASVTAKERVTGKSASCDVTVAEWSDWVTLTIPVTSEDGALTPVLEAGEPYRFVASGTWYPWGNVSSRPADAAWYGPSTWWEPPDPSAWTEHDSLRINDTIPAWLGSSDGVTWAPHTVSLATHEYRYEYLGTGAPARLWLYDTPYWDNTGELSVRVQRHN